MTPVAQRSSKAFHTWREWPAPRRGLLVRDLGNAVREQIEPLGELISLEMGKIRAEGIGEVQEMVDICDFAVGLSRQLYGLTMHSERPGHRMYEQWHPLGPIGIITAFNFPLAVWSWNATIAAVCGDTMIWKPSELAPLTAVAMQHISNKVMADHGLSGIFNLVIGGPEIGKLLTADPRLPLDLLHRFHPIPGAAVAQTVAGRLGRSFLELGGNNAIVVAADADLDLAVRGILFGAVGTAGQRCTSTRRIIMHKDYCRRPDQPLGRCLCSRSQLGDPLAEGTLMGPLVTETAVHEHDDGRCRSARPGRRSSLRRQGPAGRRPAVRGTHHHQDACPNRDRAHRDLRANSLFADLRQYGRGDGPAQRRAAGAFQRHLHRQYAHGRSLFWPPAVRTAASPMSISAPPARKLAVRLVAKKKPAAGASPAPMPGKPTCAARPIRSTGQPNCLLRRESRSAEKSSQQPLKRRAKIRGRVVFSTAVCAQF